jgi:hypothetical protein
MLNSFDKSFLFSFVCVCVCVCVCVKKNSEFDSLLLKGISIFGPQYFCGFCAHQTSGRLPVTCNFNS